MILILCDSDHWYLIIVCFPGDVEPATAGAQLITEGADLVPSESHLADKDSNLNVGN